MKQESEEVISNFQEVHLKLWEEYVGVYNGLQFTKFSVIILFLNSKNSNTGMVFARGTPEEETIKRQLRKEPTGLTIGVLLTDSHQNPILIRKITRRA